LPAERARKSKRASRGPPYASAPGTGRYAFVHERRPDLAAGIGVVDPIFMLDAVRDAVEQQATRSPRARRRTSPGPNYGTRTCGPPPTRTARQQLRERQREAVRSNLGLGHDLREGLMDPSPTQLRGLQAIVCLLIVRHYRELIAFGAGWTDPERQPPVGDGGRLEPHGVDAIVDADLRRALADPDPLRGIAGLVARLDAAFVLDPDGISRTKALGTERMARKLRDALPGGADPLRVAVWEFLRPMLSPRLAELHHDAFVIDEIAHHRGPRRPPARLGPRRHRPRGRGRHRAGRIATERPSPLTPSGRETAAGPFAFCL
jgi:hypothetical protein